MPTNPILGSGLTIILKEEERGRYPKEMEGSFRLSGKLQQVKILQMTMMK
jgi:hypothetical protein